MKKETIRRLGYDVQRSLERQVGQVSRQRGQINGNTEPSHPRKKKKIRRPKKDSTPGRLGDRKRGETSGQSLAEEIEGARSRGSPGIGEISEERRERDRRLSPFGGGRFPSMNLGMSAAEKRARGGK